MIQDVHSIWGSTNFMQMWSSEPNKYHTLEFGLLIKVQCSCTVFDMVQIWECRKVDNQIININNTYSPVQAAWPLCYHHNCSWLGDEAEAAIGSLKPSEKTGP